MKSFTFKVHKPTGKYRSFHSEYADIKINGKRCGFIQEASVMSSTPIDERYSIYLTVIDDSEKCGWKNIKLRAKFPSMDKAKEFVKSNSTAIQNKFNLYLHQD